MKAREIYNVLKSIVYPIHAHSDQLIAIARWIESDFEYKPDKKHDNKHDKSLRVKFFPIDVDETYIGTVIEEKQNFYVVVPDENLQLTQNWDKRYCVIIKQK